MLLDLQRFRQAFEICRIAFFSHLIEYRRSRSIRWWLWWFPCVHDRWEKVVDAIDCENGELTTTVLQMPRHPYHCCWGQWDRVLYCKVNYQKRRRKISQCNIDVKRRVEKD
jgi:hypothetical protein